MDYVLVGWKYTLIIDGMYALIISGMHENVSAKV